MTSFFGCQDILQNNNSANAETISAPRINLLEIHGLDIGCESEKSWMGEKKTE